MSWSAGAVKGRVGVGGVGVVSSRPDIVLPEHSRASFTPPRDDRRLQQQSTFTFLDLGIFITLEEYALTIKEY